MGDSGKKLTFSFESNMCVFSNMGAFKKRGRLGGKAHEDLSQVIRESGYRMERAFSVSPSESLVYKSTERLAT